MMIRQVEDLQVFTVLHLLVRVTFSSLANFSSEEVGNFFPVWIVLIFVALVSDPMFNSS